MPDTDATPAVLSKSDFVRSLPVDMSVKDVLAKAKEAGIVMAPSLVGMVRARMRSVSKASGQGDSPAKPAIEMSAAPARATKARAKPARKMPVAKKSTAQPAAPTKVSTPRIAPARDALVAEFTALVIEMGIARAKELVDEVSRKLAALLDE